MRRPPPPEWSLAPPQTALVLEPVLSSCVEFQGRKALTFLNWAVEVEELV